MKGFLHEKVIVEFQKAGNSGVIELVLKDADAFIQAATAEKGVGALKPSLKMSDDET